MWCVQNVVGLVKMTVQWLIPDTSTRLRNQIRKEAYLTNEIIINQERMRAKALNSGQVTSGDFLQGERNAVVSNAMLPRKRKSSGPEEIALSHLYNVWELSGPGKIFLWKWIKFLNILIYG